MFHGFHRLLQRVEKFYELVRSFEFGFLVFNGLIECHIIHRCNRNRLYLIAIFEKNRIVAAVKKNYVCLDLNNFFHQLQFDFHRMAEYTMYILITEEKKK